MLAAIARLPMKEGAIPQMTAVGPPEGSARDKEVAMAVHLPDQHVEDVQNRVDIRVQNGIGKTDWRQISHMTPKKDYCSIHSD
jgi:hypothetical protein